MGPVKTLVIAALTGLSLQQSALADEKPPAGAMALSVIVTKLEQQGYTPIVDVSLDGGRWEVEVYKNSEKRELKIDPNTGKILSDKPDKD